MNRRNSDHDLTARSLADPMETVFVVEQVVREFAFVDLRGLTSDEQDVRE